MNYSSDLKIFANSRALESNFKSFSRSLDFFFLTVSQNNFGNKIPIPKPMVAFLSRIGLHLQLGQRKYNSEILHFFVALAML